MGKTAGNTKVIRANTNPESSAVIKVSEKAVNIIGTPSSFIAVNNNGIGLVGSQSDISMGPQRRCSGMWVRQTEMLDMIPETIVTPIPNIMVMPPMTALVNMAKDVAFFAAMLM